MMTGGSPVGQPLGPGLVSWDVPLRKQDGDPRWPGGPGWDPGHGGRAVLPAVAL